MCTCIDFKTKDTYFGRNLDLEYHFNEKVVVTPRNYEFTLKNGKAFKTKYAMIGMAMISENYPLYAEAANEEGLAIAGLYFPGSARYNNIENNKLSLAPYELIPYFLGLYKSVIELRKDLVNLNIIDIPYNSDLPLTDLHWMISDGKECIVVEQTYDGLKIYDNPVGVLTNNPSFDYQLTNLNNYSNLTPYYQNSKFSKNVELKQYGQGMGAIGLPGDNSPVSRFVRACFNKLNSDCNDDEESSVTQFFHILDVVSMVKGVTVTSEGKNDITIYSCCMNITKGIYYYKTYNNSQITAINLIDELKNRNQLTIFDLVENQQIKYELQK